MPCSGSFERFVAFCNFIRIFQEVDQILVVQQEVSRFLHAESTAKLDQFLWLVRKSRWLAIKRSQLLIRRLARQLAVLEADIESALLHAAFIVFFASFKSFEEVAAVVDHIVCFSYNDASVDPTIITLRVLLSTAGLSCWRLRGALLWLLFFFEADAFVKLFDV